MSRQIVVDDDVYRELIRRAVEMDMAFRPVSDVLRAILDQVAEEKPESLTKRMTTDSGVPPLVSKSASTSASSTRPADGIIRYPWSNVSEVQKLLGGLKETVLGISPGGLRYHEKSKKWVASPNTVTIRVQDSRARNLLVTVYGRPDDFRGVTPGESPVLDIRDDMSGYSRFVLRDENQLAAANRVIQYSFRLKKQRGRL